jgi:hypothetical protein
VRHALAAQTHLASGLAARRDRYATAAAVDCRYFDAATKCGTAHADGDAAEEIGTVTLEKLVFLHFDEDVEITGGATAHPRFTFTGQADARAGFDTCRNVDRKRTVFLDASGATARLAGILDDLAEAGTCRTRAFHGEETLLGADLAHAGARGATGRLCAAFGTTSAAPMLHVAGVTPEATGALLPGADAVRINAADLAGAWRQFNAGAAEVDLIAFGSPHFSAPECRALDAALAGRKRAEAVHVIATVGQQVLDEVRADGTLARLTASGVQVVPDICWCSISEPVFPPEARVLMTNSGKYAHYAPGLSGRAVRFGSLADCADSAITGTAPSHPPSWLTT